MIGKSAVAFFVLMMLILSALAIAPAPVSATVETANLQVSASLDLENRATYVVVGQVKSAEARWNEGAIYTYVQLLVEECLKGDYASHEITIRHRGGEVGSIGLRDSTAPQFESGERVKVFLTPIAGTNKFAVVGGKQGKISLSQSASSGYSYDGIHWSASDLPVKYYINENGTPDIAGTADEFSAVQRSFQTWEDDAGSYIDYTYVGATTRVGSHDDGFNVVSWQHIDGPSGTLAETLYWYEPTSRLLTEFDIVFDEDETWSISGEADKMDLQNVATHEVGHSLVLNDLYDPADSEQTMYGYSYPGETKKRDLYTGDIAGIRFIYGLSTITYTVDTNPTGLQIRVDGTNYTTPYSFSWYAGTQHFVDALSPQDTTTGERQLFDRWSDGGAQFHLITVGPFDASLTAYYQTQYQVSFTFKTDDNLQIILPTHIRLLGGSPNNTLTTLNNYSNVWLDDAQWTITEILWQGNNVVPSNHPTASLTPNFEWTVRTRIFPTRFNRSFKDNNGLTLPTNPSSFRLRFPNGTLSEPLKPAGLYYIQNGTTGWNSILWQDVEVTPEDVAFDASDGNPSVNCRIYDFTIRVTDPLGLPVQGASVSVIESNGLVTEAATRTDGAAIFTLIPQGTFTARVSYIGQTTTLRGYVAEAARNPVEVQIIFSLPVVLLILVPTLSVACAIILVVLRLRRHAV